MGAAAWIWLLDDSGAFRREVVTFTGHAGMRSAHASLAGRSVQLSTVAGQRAPMVGAAAPRSSLAGTAAGRLTTEGRQ